MTNPILGYDIDGQPLRAGDRVVAVAFKEHVQYNGTEYIILGNDVTPCNVEFGCDVRVKRSDGAIVDSYCARLRKLPPKQDYEPGSWAEIVKLGWKPNLAPSTADC